MTLLKFTSEEGDSCVITSPILQYQDFSFSLSNNPKIRGFEKISEGQWIADYHTDEPMKAYSRIKLPKRATAKSGGYDFFSPISFILLPNEDIKIPTGVKAYMLDDEKLEISPRSGLGFKHYLRLANTIGKIDCDFYNNPKTEGHIWIKVRNEGKETLKIEQGDAIAQASFEKYLLADGDDFSGNEREGGLGHTGMPATS